MHRIATLLIGICFFSASAALAQTGAGTVQGTVTNASGAVMPGARITLKHDQTAREYATETNAAGFFKFPPAQAGDYTLSVATAGFDAWRGRLILQVGQVALIDAALKIASSTTEMTVAGLSSSMWTIPNEHPESWRNRTSRSTAGFGSRSWISTDWTSVRYPVRRQTNSCSITGK
jgi:hypothetical protein